MPMTLEDIARICSVSRSTVSRVINGEPNVSEKTREKVMETIRKIDFQPNLAARGLAVGRTRVLGLVIPMGVTAIFADPFFPLLIQGVTSACNALDHSVMLWLAEPEYERRTIRQILYNGLVDGVIVASMLTDDTLVENLIESRLPFVLIGRHPSNDRVHYIDIDNRSASRQAVHCLMRNGCKRIATINGPANMIAGMDRLQGYLDALHERGINPDPALIAPGDFTDAGGYYAMQHLLAQHPDGIFAASDTMAMGAMRAIQDAGLRVPEDIAVIGFDDVPQAAHANPPLTTLRQPIQRMGSLAAETLVEIISHPTDQVNRMIMPVELIIRQSTRDNI